MKVFPRVRFSSNHTPLWHMHGMKFLLCLPLAINWKNFVLESPSLSQVILDYCFQYNSSWDRTKKRSILIWEICCSSSLERILLLLIESREFSSKSRESLCILRDPKVTEAHLRSLSFGLINLFDRMKAPHPSGLISVHHSWMRFPWFSLEYQAFLKWKVRILGVCGPNSR